MGNGNILKLIEINNTNIENSQISLTFKKADLHFQNGNIVI